MTRKILTGIALLLTLTAAEAARAEPVDAVRWLLRANDRPPTLEALRRAAPNPLAALETIAADNAELMLLRRRAVLMLGTFPAAQVEPTLVGLLEGSPHSELRRAAARALTRQLAERDPDRLATLLIALLASDDPADREVAVGLLAPLPSAAARAALRRQRTIERHRAVVQALRSAHHRSPER